MQKHTDCKIFLCEIGWQLERLGAWLFICGCVTHSKKDKLNCLSFLLVTLSGFEPEFAP